MARQTASLETIVTPQSTPRAETIPGNPGLQRALQISILVSIAYYLTAKIGFRFSLQPGSVSTLWMPNSIVLAGLLLLPRKWWWVLIALTLPTHLAAETESGVPMTMVLSWFVSNSVQALLGAFLINYFAGPNVRLSNSRDLAKFLFFGAFAAPVVASFLDSAFVKLNGWGDATYWQLWRLRCFSNVIATITLVPFVLEWSQPGILKALKQASLMRYLEAAILIVALAITGFIVFNSDPNTLAHFPARLYCPLPFLVWATVRFGLRGVSIALLVVTFLAITGATHGSGPFVASSASDNALSIQAFLIVISLPLLMLAAVIEERRATEESARDNEERLILALKAAQMGMWEWQLPSNRLTWSATVKSASGLPASANLTLEEFLELVHPEDRKRVELAVTRALEDGAPFELEFRLVRDEASYWWLCKGKVFFDQMGKPNRMLGVAVDITEHKLAEQHLVEVNQRNRAILRAIPDAMFLQDANGVYLDYYTRDPTALLVPPQKFLGKNFSEVLPPELAVRVREVVARVRETEEPQILEYSLMLSNEERQFEARVVSAEGDNVLSIVRDVTEARRATESLKQSEARLLASTQRIRALAAQLIKAQESERRRIANLLHDDLGQNIAALGLTISKLKRKQTPTNGSLVEELTGLGTQVRNLTRQVRKLSHQLHPEVLEHLGLVAALESYVAELGYDERIRINFSAEVETAPVPQDVAVCLYRVALEAVRNVSMHSGATSADVNLKEIEGQLVLEVSDSGHGFDVEKAKRGRGLGLASSEERVRLLNGSLEIESDSTTGTRLIARVPLSNGS